MSNGLLSSALAGLALWSVVAIHRGGREPWDLPAFWSSSGRLAIALSFALGLTFFPARLGVELRRDGDDAAGDGLERLGPLAPASGASPSSPSSRFRAASRARIGAALALRRARG
jgi:hypothetical protein